jgi:anti-sigma-K factor RskA
MIPADHAITHKLADGCCSAVTPCSWQQKKPTTICDTCRAASPSVAAWLAGRAKESRERSSKPEILNDARTWHLAQSAAFEAAHAYAVARPDRITAPTQTQPVALSVLTSDADLAYLAGLAISSKDATLARIAAALLLAR